MSILQNMKNIKIFKIFSQPEEADLSKVRFSFRRKRIMDGGAASNERLLKGIYTGANQDFCLSSYLAGGMIDVPRNITGIPGIIPKKGENDELVKELNPLIVDEFPVIITTMLVCGTAWRWARWSDKLLQLTWEAIPDSAITSIVIDIDTGEISEIWTNEQIEYNKDETNKGNITRIRHISRDLITEEWKGDINKFEQYRNTFGIMPIPFGHDCYEGEWRGNSVFSRVLRWLKSIHDISYKRDEILTDFEPKIIQTVKNVNTWLHNNGHNEKNDSEFDPFGKRFFANQENERTEFLFLSSDATSQHTEAIKDNELKVIKGSKMPELFFGALATGNHASTETDRLLALENVKGIRRELTKGTQQLINQSLKILSFMRFTQPPQVNIEWGNLSMLSEIERAEVMSRYASSICQLLNSGSVSKEGAFFFTKKLYPDFPAEDADHFMAGLNDMLVNHSNKVGQSAFESGGGGVY